MSGLLLGRSLWVRTCWFHDMITLSLWVVSTDFGTWSYQCLLSNFTLISLHVLKCIWTLTLPCFFTHCSFANIGLADMICSTVLSNRLQSMHSLFLFVIFFFCNAWSWAAIVSLSASPFRSHLDNHRNMPSSLISLLSTLANILAMHYFTLPLFFKNPPNFIFMRPLPFMCNFSHLIFLILMQPLLPL